jgi:hypothetical protein
MEQALIDHGYTGVKSVWVPRECPTGIGGNPCLPSGTNCSLHNYGIAVDIDPFGYGNPHFQRRYGDGWDFSDIKLTQDQVEAVETIENTFGERMFRWLGWTIGDTMHFEAQVSPDRCQVDWTTITGDPMALSPEEEAFVRKLKAQFDSASSAGFMDEFEEAKAAGIYSNATKPDDAIFASKLAVFLKRAGALPVPPTSGVTLADVKSEITKTKLTPAK